MRPGILSQKGFLGATEELDNLLVRDEKTLDKIGVTFSSIADQLELLIKTALDQPHHKASVGIFRISVTVFPGFQICPWAPDIHGGQCTYGKGVRYGSLDWCIRNLESNLEMCGSGLMVHLIRDHHFFEGIESPYRIDPIKISRLLNLG